MPWQIKETSSKTSDLKYQRTDKEGVFDILTNMTFHDLKKSFIIIYLNKRIISSTKQNELIFSR